MKFQKLDFLTDINKTYAEHMDYDKIDRFMVNLLWFHLAVVAVMVFTNSFLKVAAYYPTPFSWRVTSYTEGLVTFAIALATAAFTAAIRGKVKNHYAWRVWVTLAFTTFSYLLVFISGGSIEMHFHFFAIIALMTIYSDWRLGWILLVAVGLHHGILNYVAPTWVYFYGRNDFSVIAHALPVLLAVIFTTKVCNSNRRSIMGVLLTIKWTKEKLGEA